MVEYDFDGQVAFVTGAARGQGESHAVHYARHGADVVVTDVPADKESVGYRLGTESGLRETAEAVRDEGGEALAIEGDVTREGDIESAVQEAVDEFGQIDVLANNAGISSYAEAVAMDERTWDEMVDTNLKGVWLCAKHVGQHFVERGDGGKIVSTSSTSGFSGTPIGAAHYVAAKHGVRGLTKTLALELAEYDVNVNAVCPTAIDTPMVQGMLETYGEEVLDEGAAQLAGPFNLFDPGEMAESRDISEAYMWLSSDAARYVTGIYLPVDAGAVAK